MRVCSRDAVEREICSGGGDLCSGEGDLCSGGDSDQESGGKRRQLASALLKDFISLELTELQT